MIFITVIGVVILIALSAFFSGSEAAIFHLSRVVRDKLIHEHKKYKLLKEPEKLLSTILLGNTLVNIGISVMIASLTYKIMGELATPTEFVLTLCIAYFILVWGEFAPKYFGLTRAVKLSSISVPIISFLRYILLPITSIFDKLAGSIKRERKQLLHRDALFSLVETLREESSITSVEEDFIESILRLRNKPVKEIMVPRDRMEYVTATTSIRKVLNNITYSRLPVFSQDGKEVIGVLYIKDLLKAKRGAAKSFARHPHFVSPNTRVWELLEYFRKTCVHIAIVRDTNGEILGLVTLDDVIRSLLGITPT